MKDADKDFDPTGKNSLHNYRLTKLRDMKQPGFGKQKPAEAGGIPKELPEDVGTPKPKPKDAAAEETVIIPADESFGD